MTSNLTILPVGERLEGIVPDVERVVLEPIIAEIEELKRRATPSCWRTTT